MKTYDVGEEFDVTVFETFGINGLDLKLELRTMGYESGFVPGLYIVIVQAKRFDFRRAQFVNEAYSTDVTACELNGSPRVATVRKTIYPNVFAVTMGTHFMQHMEWFLENKGYFQNNAEVTEELLVMALKQNEADVERSKMGVSIAIRNLESERNNLKNLEDKTREITSRINGMRN